MAFVDSLQILGRVCFPGLLPLMLCQCQMVENCLNFFERHSSRGHNSKVSDNLPSRAITVEEFVAGQSHRGVSEQVLRTRFRVADANRDGLLTSEEVELHRAAAAQNKKLTR